MLDQKTLKTLIHYDKNTGTITSLHNSKRRKIGDVLGSTNTHGYVVVRIKGTKYCGHRLAWLYETGEWPENQLDHINRVRHDNRIENLRECTIAENAQNRKVSVNNSSGISGVTFCKERRLWRARINLNKKAIHLGWFTTYDEAVAARTQAKTSLHTFNPREDTRAV